MEAIGHLTRFALGFPETRLDYPWGENAVKVREKVFVFLSAGRKGDVLGITAKLPQSADAVLAVHEFASPAGYGLGKAGWVSAFFQDADDIPLPLLEGWIEESYRAVAPKRLVKALQSGGTLSSTSRES